MSLLLLVGVGGGGRAGRTGRERERVEEKEAVINRTNHANARRCAAQREGEGGNGVERGGGGWRCWVPIPIWGVRGSIRFGSIRRCINATLSLLSLSL
jgi:hypothetical protein